MHKYEHLSWPAFVFHALLLIEFSLTNSAHVESEVSVERYGGTTNAFLQDAVNWLGVGRGWLDETVAGRQEFSYHTFTDVKNRTWKNYF